MKHTALATALLIASCSFAGTALAACPDFLNQSMRKLHSTEMVNLCEATADKAVLFVNTASHCGFTPQFKGLEAVHQKYKDGGLVVVGFASDDFRQAAKDEEQAANICYKNYGVSFLMMAPSTVTGEEANPVFAELARQTTQPRWNFNKYVVDRKGKVLAHFGSSTKPGDASLQRAIERAL